MLKHDDMSVALKEFSAIRNTDAEAICDLAMYNYLEVILHSNQKKNFILLWLRPVDCRLLQKKNLKNSRKKCGEIKNQIQHTFTIQHLPQSGKLVL